MVANLVRLLAVEGVVGVAEVAGVAGVTTLVAVKGRAVRGLHRLLVVEVGAAVEVEVKVVMVWRLK